MKKGICRSGSAANPLSLRAAVWLKLGFLCLVAVCIQLKLLSLSGCFLCPVAVCVQHKSLSSSECFLCPVAVRVRLKSLSSSRCFLCPVAVRVRLKSLSSSSLSSAELAPLAIPIERETPKSGAPTSTQCFEGQYTWILLVMSTGTRAMVRMEEQMALLMQKLDEQCQQIKCLTKRQSTQWEEMEQRQYQMEKRVNSLMEEQETLQQEMRLKHKQDSEADTLAQPQTFSGYSAATIQKPMPFDGSIPWDTYKLQFEAVAMMNHWGEQDKAAHLTISLRGPATGVLSSLPPEEHHNYAALTTALEIRFGAKHQVELN